MADDDVGQSVGSIRTMSDKCGGGSLSDASANDRPSALLESASDDMASDSLQRLPIR